ncbi:Polyketide cyclase / dehydrase and lipid transport [Azoarcus sp. Aa7]|nr:Polyketide cyclase / dehydrase and lipid transport [Azoarcus sp. Aa7]
MYKIATSHEFDAPAAVLWDFLQDFAHIERWWPRHDPAVQIDRVDMEGEGVGMIRHIYNKGYDAPVSERLDALDPAKLTYSLSIVGNKPMGITHYQATGRIEALPDDRSRLNYASEFMTESGKPDDAEAWLRIAYELMFAGLAAAVTRRAGQ